MQTQSRRMTAADWDKGSIKRSEAVEADVGSLSLLWYRQIPAFNIVDYRGWRSDSRMVRTSNTTTGFHSVPHRLYWAAKVRLVRLRKRPWWVIRAMDGQSRDHQYCGGWLHRADNPFPFGAQPVAIGCMRPGSCGQATPLWVMCQRPGSHVLHRTVTRIEARQGASARGWSALAVGCAARPVEYHHTRSTRTRWVYLLVL